MSWSLVRRGLDLFGDEDELTQTSCNSNKIDGGSTGKKTREKRVNTHRHGIQRAAKQKKRQQQQQKDIRNQIVQKQVTNALKDFKKKSSGDLTEKNIKLLRKIDGKINATHSKKIINYHEKTLEERITKSEWIERGKRKEEAASNASVFTDEDFEKMNDIWLRLNQ